MIEKHIAEKMDLLDKLNEIQKILNKTSDQIQKKKNKIIKFLSDELDKKHKEGEG